MTASMAESQAFCLSIITPGPSTEPQMTTPALSLLEQYDAAVQSLQVAMDKDEGVGVATAKVSQARHALAQVLSGVDGAKVAGYRYGTALLHVGDAPAGEPDCKPLYDGPAGVRVEAALIQLEVRRAEHADSKDAEEREYAAGIADALKSVCSALIGQAVDDKGGKVSVKGEIELTLCSALEAFCKLRGHECMSADELRAKLWSDADGELSDEAMERLEEDVQWLSGFIDLWEAWERLPQVETIKASSES